MNCEYCRKSFGQKKNERQYKHINIEQPISTHIFCSRDCKTKWCFAVQENRLDPNKKTSYLVLNLQNQFLSEIKDLNVLKDFLSKREYKKRYKYILNKKEFREFSFIEEDKVKKYLKV